MTNTDSTSKTLWRCFGEPVSKHQTIVSFFLFVLFLLFFVWSWRPPAGYLTFFSALLTREGRGGAGAAAASALVRKFAFVLVLGCRCAGVGSGSGRTQPQEPLRTQSSRLHSPQGRTNKQIRTKPLHRDLGGPKNKTGKVRIIIP